jgi:tRNA pseudouridine38-40 synthase
MLPSDVAVRAATDALPGFHARYHARRKTYFYQAYVARDRDPFLDRYALHLRAAPDFARMRAAAERLQGRHDFRSFATGAADVADAVRHLMRVRVVRGARGFRIYLTADGFLRHMARALAGLVLRVGTREEAFERVDDVLARCSRSAGPVALPPHGLVLWRVDY